MIAGAIIMGLLALIALVFTALLLVSAWYGVREELVPGFRITPPGPGSLGLALVGMILPALLTALFTGYLSVWIIGRLLEPH
jgi:hypothetical protein